MEYKITELMSDYTDYEFSPAEDREISVEQIKAMTMEKMKCGGKAPVRKLSRTLLVAAALAAILAITALAVYTFTMSDRVMDDTPARENEQGEVLYDYSPVGQSPAGEGLPSMETVPEYMAFAELAAYGRENKIHDARQLLAYEDPHRACYGYGYENMAKKMDEIAEKYDLRLWQQHAMAGSGDELCALLGIERFGVESGEQSTATVYDDGGFQLQGYGIAGKPEVQVNLNRAVKGTLSVFHLMGYAPESYECESYMDASGITVNLAFHEKQSMLFVDMETCYVTAKMGGISSMEMLRTAAESIDFAVLDTIDGETVAPAVADLARNQNSAAAVGSKTSEKAAEVFGILGDRSLPTVPEGYYLQLVDVTAPEDSLNSLWQEYNEGCFAEVLMSYAAEDGESTIGLRYIRAWSDGERTESTTGEQYAAQKAHMEAEHEFDATFVSEITECEINGQEGFYVTNPQDGSLHLCWMDEENDLFYTLTTPAGFAPEAVVAMAVGISMK